MRDVHLKTRVDPIETVRESTDVLRHIVAEDRLGILFNVPLRGSIPYY